MDFYEKVIHLCREKGVSRSKMADDIGISRSAPRDWENGKAVPRSSTTKKIADYFGVPVDYLRNDGDVITESVADNHGIIGRVQAPVTIINGSEKNLSEQAVALLKLFDELDVINKARLLAYASDLKNGG